MQKKDRDCGDNAQRDEDEERDPHANRNAVGKRVTTGWHSHESREPFVEFHGFQSPGGSPRGVSRFTYDLCLNVVGLGSPNRLSHRIAAGHTE